MSTTAPLSARNAEWMDRELLDLIYRLAQQNPDGLATTTEIGLQMGFAPVNGNGRRKGRHASPATKVGTRLAIMRDRLGLLESIRPDTDKPYKEPGDRDLRWRLTDVGLDIHKGKIRESLRSALDKLDPGQQAALMHQLMLRGFVQGEETTALVLRRQFLHDAAQRPLTLRRR